VTPKELLVYVPVGPPDTNQQKMTDPFLGLCGRREVTFHQKRAMSSSIFALAAKADYATEIRKVFNDNPNPEFSLIDSIGHDSRYPVLQDALKSLPTPRLLK
jgi:hypothetical protein